MFRKYETYLKHHDLITCSYLKTTPTELLLLLPSLKYSTATLKQHKSELHKSTYTWLFFNSQPSISVCYASTDSTNCRLKTAFSIHSWKSMDVDAEGRADCMHTLRHFI